MNIFVMEYIYIYMCKYLPSKITLLPIDNEYGFVVETYPQIATFPGFQEKINIFLGRQMDGCN